MSTLAEEMKAHALEAQKFSRKHLVLELDFSETSIREMESHCDSVEYAIRGGKSAENVEMLTRVWGAYLGESLRRATNAEWVEEQTSTGRRIGLKASGGLVYPHEFMRKRLTEKGAGTVLSFFQAARDTLNAS